MNAISSQSSEATSSSLLQNVKAHDPEAWVRLSRLYGPEVYRWARQVGLQDSDAADITQDVFLAVANNMHKFRCDRVGDSFRGWLWTIARNKIRDFHRQRGERPAGEGGTDAYGNLQSVADSPPDDSAEAKTSTAIRLSQRALDLIKSEFETQTWQIFYWATFDNRSTAEIAEDLGMTKSAVRQAKYRITKRLRQELEGLVDEL